MTIYRGAAAAVLIWSLAAAAPGRAVDTPAASSAPEASTDDGTIVVTATKRSANVQDVPLSISVVGGAAIAQRQLRDGIAVAREVPNLQAESAMGAAMPRYRLRGALLHNPSGA